MSQSRLGRAVLVLVILLGVADGGAAPKGSQCAAEIWHVWIDGHDHFRGSSSPAGGYNPASGVGSPTSKDVNFRVHGRYVSKPTSDGRFVWTHRTIRWSGHSTFDVQGCHIIRCEAGGEGEFGPKEGGGRAPALTPDEAKLITDSVRCTTEKKGNCFGYFGGGLALPAPEIVSRDQVPYRKITPDGTRYSVVLETQGWPSLIMWAHPTHIPPNKGATKDKSTDDPTSQIRVVASCDGKPLENEDLEFKVDVQPNSGGHNHIPARPRGKLNGVNCGVETGAPPDDVPCIVGVKTDAKGHASVKFESPLTGVKQSAGYGTYDIGIAGDYKITAKMTRYPDRRATATVFSGVEHLQPFPAAQGLTGDASNTTAHPHGSYATTGTFEAFNGLARDFQEQQKLHNDSLVECVKLLSPAAFSGPLPDPTWPVVTVDLNDVALPKGGIFDLEKDWKPSHYTHNKGEGGDMNRFGAGDENAGLNPNLTGRQCDGSSIPFQWWWGHLLLGLGENYGKWDCKDLQVEGPNCEGPLPLTSGTAIAPAGVAWWFPHRLHLHVEDKK
jgi:hypothetical protein